MKRILDIIRRNKLYAVIAVFIISINLLMLLDRNHGRERAREAGTEARLEKGAAEGEETGNILEQDMESRRKKIMRLAEEDPLLYVFIGTFNLLILLMMFLGVLIDLYLLGKTARGKPLDMRINAREAPRWNLADVIRVVLIFLGSGYIFVIAQAFFLRIFPLLRNDNFRMVFNTVIMNLVGISVILYFVTRKHGQRIRDLGLTAKDWKKGVFYAVAGYLALIPVLAVIMFLTYLIIEQLQYRPPLQPIVEVFLEEKQTTVLWLSTVFAAVFGPVAEEIFFRGFMYPAVKKKAGALVGILLTAGIFAFLHAHIVGFAPILALGVLLAYLYEKTGSLVPSITVHIAHNLAMVVLVFMMRNIG
ncbi:MAG: CPBP family intramembrane metalloprotease [Candidatus Omnitrophica bacterium]|nr:CPBP family intramembrane metalloprotease [Candidatus Omnitrophota bacterium]